MDSPVENVLPEKDQDVLRSSGLLHEGEIAIKVINSVVAVDLLTGGRRRLNCSGVMLESNRQLLKG